MTVIFSPEVIFMLSIALIWILIAVVQDFRKREVANWWNFSLIAFILAFRLFLSIEKNDYGWFLWGLIGFIGGFILANLFYYARMFAGGDAKLLIALGTIIPLSLEWKTNSLILLIFVATVLICGGIYGIIYSIILAIKYRRRFLQKFKPLLREHKSSVLSVVIISALMLIFSILSNTPVFIYLGCLLFISPWLLLFAKTIEESCLTVYVKPSKLTIGDWLAESLKIGKRVIRPYWQGLSENELKLIQKKVKRKVLVKYGLEFTPAFLFALILTILFFYLKII